MAIRPEGSLSIKSSLGRCSVSLRAYAQGLDRSVVSPAGSVPIVKSIGNSRRIMLYILCESVTERLRVQGPRCPRAGIPARYGFYETA